MNTEETKSEMYTHSGRISKMNGSSLIVSLDEDVHCESCRAKGTCGISDATNKEIEISNAVGDFKLNEKVAVVLKKQLGLKAVFVAYVLPFLIMLSTLLISSSFLPEWMAGLLSLFILAPYYLMLHLLKNTFQKTFKISILKI